MKAVINVIRKKYLTGVTLVITLFLMSCTTTKVAFLSSSKVPAAEGSVNIDKDKNNNYKVSVVVNNLAQPEKLEPSKNFYVVWMKTMQAGTKNIGQLKTAHPFLSKALKSSLSTVTSFKPESIFITAEDMANIQDPQGEVVLTTENFAGEVKTP